jgi:hypothetical protein
MIDQIIPKFLATLRPEAKQTMLSSFDIIKSEYSSEKHVILLPIVRQILNTHDIIDPTTCIPKLNSFVTSYVADMNELESFTDIEERRAQLFLLTMQSFICTHSEEVKEIGK